MYIFRRSKDNLLQTAKFYGEIEFDEYKKYIMRNVFLI